uniref:Uncharacterized protein n=1 Tax=Arundo donax TaxID=35708 RepID=A0A0A9G468_ARUDO
MYVYVCVYICMYIYVYIYSPKKRRLLMCSVHSQICQPFNLDDKHRLMHNPCLKASPMDMQIYTLANE